MPSEGTTRIHHIAISDDSTRTHTLKSKRNEDAKPQDGNTLSNTSTQVLLPNQAPDEETWGPVVVSGTVSTQGGAAFFGTQAAQGDIINNFGKSLETELPAWLSTVPYEQHHSAVASDLITDSGTWLFRDLAFRHWRDTQDSSLLWLRGPAGTGKTCLIAAAIEHLSKQLSGQVKLKGVTGNWRIVYFYISKLGSQDRTDPATIMRTVLKQALGSDSETSVARLAKEEWKRRSTAARSAYTEAEPLNIADSVRLLKATMKKQPLFLVLDALDECDSRKRYQLFNAIEELLAGADLPIKILISSREESDIGRRFQQKPNISAATGKNLRDVARYIRREVRRAIVAKRLLGGIVSPELETYINVTLTRKARSMFKWAELQLQELCNHERIKCDADVEDELERTSAELFEFYDRIFQRIMVLGTISRSIAMHSLRWIIYAQAPLSPQELCAALALHNPGKPVNATRQHILDSCAGLVIFDKVSGTFDFSHVSVQEFLELRPEICSPEAQTSILNAVMVVYSNQHVAQNRSVNDDSKYETLLRSYASRYWADHVDALNQVCMSSPAQKNALRMISDLLKPTEVSDSVTEKSDFVSRVDYQSLDRNLHTPNMMLASKMLSNRGYPTSAETQWSACNYLDYLDTPYTPRDPELIRERVLERSFVNRLTHGLFRRICRPADGSARYWSDLILSSAPFPAHPHIPNVSSNLQFTVLNQLGFRFLTALAGVSVNSAPGPQSLAGRPTFFYEPGRHQDMIESMKILLFHDRLDLRDCLAEDIFPSSPASQAWFRRSFPGSRSGAEAPSQFSRTWARDTLKTSFTRCLLSLRELLRLSLREPHLDFRKAVLEQVKNVPSTTAFVPGWAVEIPSANPSWVPPKPTTPWMSNENWLRWLMSSVPQAEISWAATASCLWDLWWEISWFVFHFDIDGKYTLCYAAELGDHKSFWKEFKAYRDDPDVPDRSGRTPLSYAAGAGHDRVVSALIKLNDVEVSSLDIHKRTPMWWALAGGRQSTAWILLGCDRLSFADRDLLWKRAPEWGVKHKLIQRAMPLHHPSHWKDWLMSPTLRQQATPIRLEETAIPVQ